MRMRMRMKPYLFADIENDLDIDGATNLSTTEKISLKIMRFCLRGKKWTMILYWLTMFVLSFIYLRMRGELEWVDQLLGVRDNNPQHPQRQVDRLSWQGYSFASAGLCAYFPLSPTLFLFMNRKNVKAIGDLQNFIQAKYSDFYTKNRCAITFNLLFPCDLIASDGQDYVADNLSYRALFDKENDFKSPLTGETLYYDKGADDRLFLRHNIHYLSFLMLTIKGFIQKDKRLTPEQQAVWFELLGVIRNELRLLGTEEECFNDATTNKPLTYPVVAPDGRSYEGAQELFRTKQGIKGHAEMTLKLHAAKQRNNVTVFRNIRLMDLIAERNNKVVPAP